MLLTPVGVGKMVLASFWNSEAVSVVLKQPILGPLRVDPMVAPCYPQATPKAI